jgi:hypothetical protein
VGTAGDVPVESELSSAVSAKKSGDFSLWKAADVQNGTDETEDEELFTVRATVAENDN